MVKTLDAMCESARYSPATVPFVHGVINSCYEIPGWMRSLYSLAYDDIGTGHKTWMITTSRNF